MRYQRTHVVHKAVLEVLEDRRYFSSTTFSGGVLTLTGDKDAANAIAVNSLGSQFVVAFCDSHGLIEPMSDVKQIDIIAGTVSDTIGVDPTINLPIVIQTYGGKDEITQNDPNITIINEQTTDTGTGTDSNNGNTSSTSGSGTTSNSGGTTSNSGGTTSNDSGTSSNGGSSNGGGSTTTTDSGLQAKITVVGAITTIEAGQSISVDALGSTLGNDSALTASYQWNFGDTTEGSSYNTLTGWNAGHVYNQPGTYTVTLTITGSDGAVSTATQKVTVDEASQTAIYVSTSGSDSNTGLSPSSPIPLAKAESMLQSNTALLLQSGDTFDESADWCFNGLQNVTISSYGSGAQPVILWNGARDGGKMIQGTGCTELTINGITFDSIFNTDTLETGMPFAVTPGGTDNAVINCTFLNVGYAIQGAVSPNGLLVENNTAPLMTGLRGYFVWGQGSDFTIIGNTIANSTGESLIRCGAPGITGVNVSYNTLNDEDKAAIVFQCGSYGYAAFNTVTSGPVGCGPLTSTQFADNPTYLAYRWTNAEFTDNTLYVPLMVDPGSIGVMIEGNVFYRDNWGAILINGYNTLYQIEAENVTITGNTAINNGTEGNFLQIQDEASGLNATGIVLTNNLYIAPNLTPGLEGAAVVVVDGQSNLSAFSEISGNIWPVTQWTTGAGYGEMFVGPIWAGHAGYLTAAQWNAEAPVTGNGDEFESANLPSNFFSELTQFQLTGEQILAQAA